MEILNYLSSNIQASLMTIMSKKNLDKLEEIRLRTNKNIILKFLDDEAILNYITTQKDILETLEKITESSIYTYENQISNGFITLKKGHRVGIVGNGVINDGKIVNISYISGMNIRIAKEIKGCSNFILRNLYQNEEFQNTLILGAPGTGKTTLLRDIIRQVSNGNLYSKGLNVGVVDERNEIAAMYKGAEQTDLGLRTDVISNIPKTLGIKLLIRSMSPQVIAVDEIGGENDSKMINYAMCSGAKGLFTAHGSSITDITQNNEIRQLIENKIIERIIILNPKIKEKASNIYYLDKDKREYRKCI